jgi:hypothetical protein
MVAHDNFTELSGDNVGTFTHTPVGTPRGVAVLISHPDAADFITGVTYGGVALARVNGFAVSFGSQSTSYIYFLGSGIPTGARSVVISGTSHGGHAVAITFTGSDDTEVIDSDGEGSGTAGEQDVSHVMFHSGRSAMSVVVGDHGGSGVMTPLAGETQLGATVSFVNSKCGFFRQTTPSTSDFTAGYHYTAGQAYTLAIATISEVAATEAPVNTMFEWDGVSFTAERVKEWTISRGASAELTGGTNPGQATIVLVNTPDDRYNPENAGGDLYGNLHDGIRVWIGVNEDGTVTPDAAKDVYGLFAGRITDLSPLPQAGATVAPFVEVVCADPLEWFGRQRVTLADATTRSQYDLRVEVLDALGVTESDLAVEPTTLPLSRADGLALGILDNINQANGTRHFAKPADDPGNWYTYTTVRRTQLLDGTSDAALDAGSDHVTGTSGWRVSADGIINQQKASVEPIAFPGRVLVWQPDLLPFTVTGEVIIWTEFGDYVGDPEADVDYTGSALTVDVEPFGDTAKITLTSAGTSSVTSFDVTGYLVQRGSTESVVVDDLTSQAEPRGVRAGSDLTGDYLGTLTSAHGFASHIVWRFGNHLYRPTMTVENWMPEMFDMDLFNRISLTIAELSITGRIFEIVGLTLTSDLAALDANGNPVVHHTATYVLQESRVQEPFGWFILDDSLLDDTDVLAY